MASGKIIISKSLKAVEPNGDPSRELLALLTQLVRSVNELSDRVRALENTPT